MIRRYEIDGRNLEPDENGGWVPFSDHESAIAEARKQEREKCIEELAAIANKYDDPEDYHRVRWGIRHAADKLKKGLTQ